MKKNFIISLILFSLIGCNSMFLSAQAEVKKAPVKAVSQKPIETTALNIVADPAKFLNKTVKMKATFDKFSTLGLDYKKALRPSSEYIGILLQRDNIVDNNIPLSEYHMITFTCRI